MSGRNPLMARVRRLQVFTKYGFSSPLYAHFQLHDGSVESVLQTQWVAQIQQKRRPHERPVILILLFLVIGKVFPFR